VPNALGSFGVKIRMFVSLCASLQNAGQRPLLDEGSSPGSPGMTRTLDQLGRLADDGCCTWLYRYFCRPELLLPCYSNQRTRLISAQLGGRLTSPELVLWIRTDRLDIRCRSFNPKVPGSRPGRPTKDSRKTGLPERAHFVRDTGDSYVIREDLLSD
jgi:hypothetical protein